MNQENLIEIANMRMPFGKYKGRRIIEVPEEYLIWFRKKGFPPGKLGMLLEITLEIKIEGLDDLIKPLIK